MVGEAFPADPDREQWLCWETELREDEDGDEKRTKVPRAPWEVGHTGPVSATAEQNWTDWETANEWAEKTPGWGLGFAFSEDGPFVGIDFDDCRDPTHGDIQPWVYEALRELDSYTEVSPSGTGLHTIVRGELPAAMKNDTRGIEMYDRDRFFTVTGNHLDGSPETANLRNGALERLAEEYSIEIEDAVADATHESDDSLRDTDSFGSNHPFYDIRVSELYPGITVGENVAHPEHDSSTGANFKIHDDEHTAICWRAEHQWPGKQGCGLAAPHLLAMQATGRTNCRQVRADFQDDDELAFEAWLEAVEQNLVTEDTPIWRAVRHVCDQHDLANPEQGGTPGWAAYRTACRIIRHEHGVDIGLDDPGGGADG